MSFIRRQVGLRTDAASASGSLHAKAGALKTTINTQCDVKTSTRQAPRGLVGAAGYVSVNDHVAYTTVLNITGRGRLLYLGVYPAIDKTIIVRVSVDGHLAGAGRIAGPSPTGMFCPTGDFVLRPDEGDVRFVKADDRIAVPLLIPFVSSLKIEAKVPISGHFGSVYWLYEKE